MTTTAHSTERLTQTNIQGTVEHTITAAPTETGAASTAGVADIIPDG